MTYQSKIEERVKANFPQVPDISNPSPDTEWQKFAGGIADSVANSTHIELMTEWQSELSQHQSTLTQTNLFLASLTALMGALALEPTLTTSKALASAVAGQITTLQAKLTSLSTAITNLDGKIGNYK